MSYVESIHRGDTDGNNSNNGSDDGINHLNSNNDSRFGATPQATRQDNQEDSQVMEIDIDENERSGSGSSSSSIKNAEDQEEDEAMPSVIYSGKTLGRNRQKQNKSHIAILPGELIVAIFQQLDSKSDQWAFALTCRAWFHSTIEWVWFRPMLTNKRAFQLFVRTLEMPAKDLAIPYGNLVRRLNLTSFASSLDDETMLRLHSCCAIERLTLTGCSNLSDASLSRIVRNNPNLQSIDVSQIKSVTNETLFALASTCKSLQGIYAAECKLLDDDGIGELARQCPMLKRVKMNGTKISDVALRDLVKCKHIVELDLANTTGVSNAQITWLLMDLPHLREFRIANIPDIADEAFYRLAYRRDSEATTAHLQSNAITQGQGDGTVTDVDSESRGAGANNENALETGNISEQEQLEQQFQLQLQEGVNGVMANSNNPATRSTPASNTISRNGTPMSIYNVSSHTQLDHEGNPVTFNGHTAVSGATGALAHSNSGMLVPDPSAVPARLPLFDRLRIIDLTSCNLISDASVARIVKCAPRLRNVVLAKCNNITDRAVICLAQLGQSLHYLHLGHCASITDRSISILAKSCPRIQYIDVASCGQLTNAAVKDLATLPKLKRIGLVKCHLITDQAVNALADRPRAADGENTIERVHLSYCLHISLFAITKLVNSCMRLTHLSLTGVDPFLREDLTRFCRPPPPEFTPEQRSMFCVFSGKGVERLRDHLNAMMNEQGQTLLAMTGNHNSDMTPPLLQAINVQYLNGAHHAHGHGHGHGHGHADIQPHGLGHAQLHQALAQARQTPFASLVTPRANGNNNEGNNNSGGFLPPTDFGADSNPNSIAYFNRNARFSSRGNNPSQYQTEDIVSHSQGPGTNAAQTEAGTGFRDETRAVARQGAGTPMGSTSRVTPLPNDLSLSVQFTRSNDSDVSNDGSVQSNENWESNNNAPGRGSNSTTTPIDRHSQLNQQLHHRNNHNNNNFTFNIFNTNSHMSQSDAHQSRRSPTEENNR